MRYLKVLPKKRRDIDPNWFAVSKIPDLAFQLQGRVIGYRWVLEMKNAGRFESEKFGNACYAQIASLEQWMGFEPGEIHRRYRPDLDGVR